MYRFEILIILFVGDILKKRMVCMILNVSGRTDIVAFYSKWFINRYREGFVDVRNPFYPDQVSRIYFNDVDAIFFCTKNPIPILEFLSEIQKPMLFHVTLTPYKSNIEPNVPPKGILIEAIKKISNMIGSDQVCIRYDPIFLNDQYHLEYHKQAFEHLCALLEGYTKTMIVSFIDDYKNVRNHIKTLRIKPFTEEDLKQIGISFSESARKHGMVVQTCFEECDLTQYGFTKGDCLSATKAYQMTKKIYHKWKARKGGLCSCVEMVDIGVYNTCEHFCKYCYANYDEKKVAKNILDHDSNSSLLIGTLQKKDTIKIRK